MAGYNRSKITNEDDIRSIFKKYGNIKDIAYKGSYAFVVWNIILFYIDFYIRIRSLGCSQRAEWIIDQWTEIKS